MSSIVCKVWSPLLRDFLVSRAQTQNEADISAKIGELVDTALLRTYVPRYLRQCPLHNTFVLLDVCGHFNMKFDHLLKLMVLANSSRPVSTLKTLCAVSCR